MKSIFQLKTRVALVTGLNLTFHNIELNTIMQNVSIYIDGVSKYSDGIAIEVK